jgi:hypothetical protein
VADETGVSHALIRQAMARYGEGILPATPERVADRNCASGRKRAAELVRLAEQLQREG